MCFTRLTPRKCLCSGEGVAVKQTVAEGGKLKKFEKWENMNTIFSGLMV